MLFSLASPADNVRGPQYLTAALTALHRSFRGGSLWELIIGRDSAQVGLYTRTALNFSPLVQGQLQAAYPDLRVERISDDAFAPQREEVCTWAHLRLVPQAATFIVLEQLLDRQEHQLVDPIAGILAALASRKGERLRPVVSLLARPAGRFAKWRMRRYRGVEKLSGPVWVVDLRLAVFAPPSQRDAADAKIHELVGLFGHVLAPGKGGFKLSRIRQGRLPQRMPLWRSWFVSPAELAMLWHPPTSSVHTPQLRTNESREFEPPPADRLPTLGKHPQLAVLGRTAFRERCETFGILLEDRFRHAYLIGVSLPVIPIT